MTTGYDSVTSRTINLCVSIFFNSFLTTGGKVPQLSNDQIVVSGVLESGTIFSVHYRSGMSAATNFLWEINGTKGDIRIDGPLGHYQWPR